MNCCRAMDALVDAQLSVNTALAETRAALKRAKRRARAEAREWVLSAQLRNASVAMYHLAGTAEPAVAYLRACARERHWSERADSATTALVEDLYLETGTDEIAALVDEQEPLDAAALTVAFKYVGEWRVAGWARGLNEARGVAPSTAGLLEEYENGRLTVPVAFRPRSAGVSGERRAKRFAYLLRRRWRGAYGAIPVAEHVEPAELQCKAVLHAREGYMGNCRKPETRIR